MAKAKKGFLSPYRTYSFVDKDPVIDKIRTVVEDSQESYKEIHESSGVSVTTLYNWFHGKTRRPQFATVNAVALALNHELRLMKKNGRH
jgi:DNA-binding phage protein